MERPEETQGQTPQGVVTKTEWHASAIGAHPHPQQFVSFGKFVSVGNQILADWQQKDHERMEELKRQRAFGFYQLEQLDTVKTRVAEEINDHRQKFMSQWEKIRLTTPVSNKCTIGFNN
jgi:hypothetical protein